MATENPLSSPWLVVAPDTAVNQVDLDDCSNKYQDPALLGVTMSIKIRVGTFLLTVAHKDVADPISGNSIPSYTEGDTEIITILPNQHLFYKATTISDSFSLSI